MFALHQDIRRRKSCRNIFSVIVAGIASVAKSGCTQRHQVADDLHDYITCGVLFFLRSRFSHSINLARPPDICVLRVASEQLAWLQVIGINDFRLLDPGRMIQLVGELKDPANQRPSSLLFVGRQAKDIALRELFPENNLKNRSGNAVATLPIDNAKHISRSSYHFRREQPNPSDTLDGQ